MWAMLKAPLIIGNDIRELELPSKVDIKRILSNAEVIAVNQDSRGYQARRVWSDHVGSSIKGSRVIAVKCSSGNTSSYEDSVLDQTWRYQGGRIRSGSTGLCLHEQLLPLSNSNNTSIVHMARTRSVTTVDCREATYWDAVQYRGGPVVSRSSKLCLEVDKSNNTASHGKLVQTAPCQPTSNIVDDDDDDDQQRCVDDSEHQSWTTPMSTLLNLYQRQCLTIDRDAPSGGLQEVWSVPLEAGAYAVTLLNKGPLDASMTIDTTMLGLPSSSSSSSSSLSSPIAHDIKTTTTSSYSMRDLWLHRDEEQVLREGGDATFTVRSHGVVMLKLMPL